MTKLSFTETREGYVAEIDENTRVRIEPDVDADAPDSWDYSLPVAYVGVGYRNDSELGRAFDEAYRRFGGDYSKVARYLRMFYDVVAMDWVSQRDFDFYVFATKDVLKECGTPDNQVASLVKGELATWRQYFEGDVWGVIRERKCPLCGKWEYVDSCWGFYGLDNAEVEAESFI